VFGQIRRDDQRSVAEFRGDRFEAISAAGDERDLRPVPIELTGDRLADPSARAGHDGTLVTEVEGHDGTVVTSTSRLVCWDREGRGVA